MSNTPTVLSSVTYAVKINGKNLYEFGCLSYGLPNLGMGSAEIMQSMFPERHGSYAFTSTFAPRPFVISGSIFADSAAYLRSNLDALKGHMAAQRGKLWSEPCSIRVEFADQTDRYYPCAYIGGFEVTQMGTAGPNATHANFILPLMQLSPFAVATVYTSAAPSGTGPSYTTLDLGTGPSAPMVEIEGVANGADFVLADMSFYADFDFDAIATIIDGTTVTGSLVGGGTASDMMEPGEFGKGRFVQDATHGYNWAGVYTPGPEGTIVVAGRVQFAYDTATDQYIFAYKIDADNEVWLYYDKTTDKWTLMRERATVQVTCAGTASTHATDTYMVIAASWGTAGLKVYVNGTLQKTEAATTTGPTGNTGTIYSYDSAGAAPAPFKFEYMMLYPFQLADDDVTRISATPDQVRPYNVKKTRTGNLADGVRSELNFNRATAMLLATNLGQTNDLAAWTDMKGWPLLRPPKMCFHVPNGESIAGIKVTYRKRYL